MTEVKRGSTPSLSNVSVHRDAHDMRYAASGGLCSVNDGEIEIRIFRSVMFYWLGP